MSGRGQPRGSSSTRGSNPSGSRGGSSANRGGRGGGASGAGGERQKKEAILNLQKYQDKEVRVKFQGGREVVGTLKGFDALQNLVLDDVKEEGTDGRPSRTLGLVVLRGPQITLISPTDGYEEISNPFAQAE
ncbi:U6 snRNA-associated Sm-like protein LSm7 [Filobasidium floriforme]|uniref:U6 snRNA-associated Sm-like protein LSm7 n=1 Tax=Filobasidium floriforme TaxID=5210 RepID=UPI001E8D4591|nr:U6 snRNA-associated Sm-like protein LSm7 [Filobasidium floriforme]KAH8077920.1 U6 snRNA-associated Sm-like protein LSm7 [Filobasidium floriforme]